MRGERHGERQAGHHTKSQPSKDGAKRATRHFRQLDLAGLARIGLLSEFVERDLHVRHTLPAARRIFLKAAANDLIHFAGNSGHRLGNRLRIPGEDGRERGEFGGARKSLAPGNHLVQHRPERKNVRASVERATFSLFRRNISDGAEDHSFLGRRADGTDDSIGVSVRLGDGVDLGESEIENLDRPLRRDHDVRWLQVAMDDAGGVRGGERVGDLRAILEHVAQPQPLASNQLGQGAAGDVLHRDETGSLAVLLATINFVNRNNIGMIEGGSGAGFLDKPSLAIRIGHSGRRQNLDRDFAPQTRIDGAIDYSHPTGANLLFNPVRTNGLFLHRTHTKLPYPASVLRHHGLAGLATESLLKSS